MAKRGSGDPDFEVYLDQIRGYPLLSREEEQALARRVQSARWDAWEARDRMIRCNLRLVIAVAKHYRKRGLPLSDLVEEGNIGLVHAVEKFDPEMQTRFSTYAMWWIRQAIRRAVLNTGKTVRIPTYMAEELNRWRAYARTFVQKNGREPMDDELLEVFSPAPTRRRFLLRLHHAMRTSADAVSLDVLFDSVDALVDPRAESPDLIDFLAVDIEQLRKALGHLPEREAVILRFRYGLTPDGQTKTLRQIAKIVGISRERVRQLEHKALSVLRRRLGESGGTHRRGE